MSTKVRTACDQCGWVSTWTDSQARADYAYRRHSCELQRKRVARKHRVARRKAASGPVRDCQHEHGRHVHGTRAAYVGDLCRCRACRDATAAYERHRQRQALYGKWSPYVDPQPARDHLVALAAAGVGYKRAAALAGLPYSIVALIRTNPSRRARQATVDAILAVPIDPAPGAKIDAIGTRRRIQGLLALGYSINEIAKRAGTDRQALDAALAGGWQVRAFTAAAVRGVYEEIGDQWFQAADHRSKIASARARNRALANRWPVPAAWDDEDLDDPYAEAPRIGTCSEQPCDDDATARGRCQHHYYLHRVAERAA